MSVDRFRCVIGVMNYALHTVVYKPNTESTRSCHWNARYCTYVLRRTPVIDSEQKIEVLKTHTHSKKLNEYSLLYKPLTWHVWLVGAYSTHSLYVHYSFQYKIILFEFDYITNFCSFEFKSTSLASFSECRRDLFQPSFADNQHHQETA